jgi:hypothetical protein
VIFSFIPQNELALPATVFVADGSLQWQLDPKSLSYAPPIRPPVLDRFMDIQEDQGVEGFAREYGPLRICKEHGLPASHADGCPLDRGFAGTFIEPTERWFELAKQMRSLKAACSALAKGQLMALDDVHNLGLGMAVGRDRETTPEENPFGLVLSEGQSAPTDDDIRAQVGLERVVLAAYIEKWYGYAGFGARVDWRDGADPWVQWKGTGLFASLLLCLMTKITDSAVAVLCAGECGERIPKRGGGRTWCEDCRRAGLAQKAAKDDFLARRAIGRPVNPNRGRNAGKDPQRKGAT